MKLCILIVTFVVLLFAPLASAYENDKRTEEEESYHGKVIEVQTGLPIEGVVVLGVYMREIPTLGGGRDEFVSAKEAVTNANGEFSIPGKAIGNVDLTVTVYKAGYDAIVMYDWNFTRARPEYTYNDRIKWANGIPVFSLRQLTKEEQRKYREPDYPSKAKPSTIRMFLEEIDKNMVERGLRPLRLLEED